MKQVTLLSLFLLLSFHITSAQTKTEANTQKLIGKWSILTTKTTTAVKNGHFEVREKGCNECQTVNFTADQKAVITIQNVEKEIYNWKIERNKISFIVVGTKDAEPGTFTGEYYLKFTQKDNLTELELTVTDKDGKHSVILRK